MVVFDNLLHEVKPETRARRSWLDAIERFEHALAHDSRDTRPVILDLEHRAEHANSHTSSTMMDRVLN